MKVKLTVTQILAAKLDEVLVMGEEKNLSALCQSAELREDGFGAFVVERDQQVIQNQRHGFVLFKMAFERR